MADTTPPPTPRSLLVRADKWLDLGLYYGSAMLLIVLASAVFYTVFTRYVLGSSPLWAEEVPRLLFIWLSYLGIVVATRRGQNIRVTFFIEQLPPKGRLILEIFMHLVVVIMLVVLFWNVWPIIGLNLKGTMYSTGWNNAWFFFPLPISTALMAMYELRWVVRAILEYRDTGDFDEDAHITPGSEL